MKLLYCKKCDSVVRLVTQHGQCECGHCWGRYTDDLNAEYYGMWAVKLWFDNHSFALRIHKNANENILYNLRNNKWFDDSSFSAFVIDCYGGCAKTFQRKTKREYFISLSDTNY